MLYKKGPPETKVMLSHHRNIHHVVVAYDYDLVKLIYLRLPWAVMISTYIARLMAKWEQLYTCSSFLSFAFQAHHIFDGVQGVRIFNLRFHLISSHYSQRIRCDVTRGKTGRGPELGGLMKPLFRVTLKHFHEPLIALLHESRCCLGSSFGHISLLFWHATRRPHSLHFRHSSFLIYLPYYSIQLGVIHLFHKMHFSYIFSTYLVPLILVTLFLDFEARWDGANLTWILILWITCRSCHVSQ